MGHSLTKIELGGFFTLQWLRLNFKTESRAEGEKEGGEGGLPGAAS